MEQSQHKIGIALSAVGIFAAIVFGLIWFFFLAGEGIPVGAGWYLFSFAAGLTMIVLPCTLPLAFVIVPLSMGKSAGKGIGMALAFGIGVVAMLSIYGIAAAVAGEVAIGSLGAPLETVKNWLYFVAGIFAYLFALGEIGLINFRMLTYSGAAPAFIQKRGDYLKALLLGLFLGNVGVGCPHPATPVILTRIAVSGDVFYGWLLFFVHAVGRILPLLLLAFLAVLGVNALSWLIARKDKIERATGWGMVFVAGFIVVLGLFTHDWWVNSGQHSLFEELTQEERFTGMIAAQLGVGTPHAHGLETGTGLFGQPLEWGNWVLVLLWILPLWWYYIKKSKIKIRPLGEFTGFARRKQSNLLSTQKSKLDDVEAKTEKRIMSWRFAFTVTLSAFLIVTFVYYLPTRFLYNIEQERTMESETMGHMEEAAHGSGGAAVYHEESDVREGLAVNLNITPVPVAVGAATRLDFFVNEKPGNTPVGDLEIEHEKLMHVIGVRSDLNEFFHIHTDVTDTPGLFSAHYAFLQPGLYKVWSEVKKDGVNHAFGHPEISVEGEGVTYDKKVSFARMANVGDYEVSFELEEPVIKDHEHEFSFDVHGRGGEVELEEYLGALMHITIIKDDLKRLIHTHPEGGMSTDHESLRFIGEAFAHGEEGPVAAVSDEHGINFHVVLPEAGLYKIFAQFRPQGIDLPPDEALTAAFWVEVEEKAPAALSPWWINLLWSVAAIVVLSILVKRYLRVEQ